LRNDFLNNLAPCDQGTLTSPTDKWTTYCGILVATRQSIVVKFPSDNIQLFVPLQSTSHHCPSVVCKSLWRF